MGKTKRELRGLGADGGYSILKSRVSPPRRLRQPDATVLVVDEFGICPYDRESAPAYFTLVSAGTSGAASSTIPIVFAKRKRNPEHASGIRRRGSGLVSADRNVGNGF